MIKNIINKILKKNVPDEHILNEKEIQKIMEHNKKVLSKNIHNTLYQKKGINELGMNKNIYI